MDTIVGIIVLGIIGLVVFKIYKAGSRPKEEDVLERWSAHLPGGAESGDDFLNRVETELYDRNPAFQKSRSNFMGKMMTNGQPMVRVTFDTIHSCYISYDAVGKDLCLSYALHKKNSILYLVPWLGPILFRILEVIFLNERNGLLAFTAVTLDCTRKVTDALIDELDLDRSAVKIKEASGVLGPL